MTFMLGVAKALKAMHQYRVRSGASAVKKAKIVRNDAEAADAEAAASRGRPARRVSRRDSDDTEHEPLMDGEVTISQEGVDEGDFRPYAHRDIKPGMCIYVFMISTQFEVSYLLPVGEIKNPLTKSISPSTQNRKHHDR